jgi:hypothetical protein
MELMNFMALLMIVAIINAAPVDDVQTVTVQRVEPTTTTTTSNDAAAPPDPDAGPLPGPSGIDAANNPTGMLIPSCVPTDPNNVCQLTTDTGSCNPPTTDNGCILIVGCVIL